MKLCVSCIVAGFFSLVLSVVAQTSGSSPDSAQVPPLIQFSNVATDEGGGTLSGVVRITFSLYSSQRGGEALWTETQNGVQLDSTGHYSVQLGITKPNGVPTTLFTTGEARWLGVRIAEQAEQPLVLLLSVPYALKAGDAATIGGFPPSAFVLTAPPNGDASVSTNDSSTGQRTAPPSSAVTGTGTTDFIPMWTSASAIGSSALFQSGTSPTAKIGINTTTPASTLDVKGVATIRGTLSLPPTGPATASAGTNSQGLNLASSTFDTNLAKAVNQTFRWQAEPSVCQGCVPSTLNLLFGSNGATPGETGLNIASNGLITFATGQTFPGTGDGSVTSVGSGAGLTGGPITGSGTLSIAAGGVSNAMLAHPSLKVSAGTGLAGGGSVVLGGSTTLSLDATKIPQLNAANTFTGNQTINGTGVAGNFGLTVNQPTQTGILVEGPITGVGAGLDLRSTGAGGKQWEILATGDTASQGVGKLNIRDVNTNTDVFTIDAADLVNVGVGLVVPGSTSTNFLSANVGTFVAGMVSKGPVGVGAEFKTKTVAANLDVQGNALDTLIGDPGCGANFAGIGFQNSGLSCTNYALVGSNVGDTYLNSQGSGAIHLRNNNGLLCGLSSCTNSDQMTITQAGKVGIGTPGPLESLDVAGRIRSKNVAAVATFSNGVDASGGNCLGGLTSANPACQTPDLALTETTGNVPVFIVANINTIGLDTCVLAQFALVMDSQIISQSNVAGFVGGNINDISAVVPSVTMVSLQFPAPGTHTYYVEEVDNTGGCSNGTFRTRIGTTRTLIVREF